MVSGCGSGVRFVRMDETVYAPKPEGISIVRHERGCMEPHVVIGTLSTRKKMKASFNGRSIYDEAIASLEAKARKLGADALMQISPRVVGKGMGSKVEVEATAIRYLTHELTVTSAATQTSAAP